jgi:phosphoribosylamine---glycine ligase
MSQVLNVLVVGQGGREHALVRALKQSAHVAAVHALPGSYGIALDAKCHEVDWKNFDQVLSVVRSEKIGLVVIGPEVPLDGGLSDFLREAGVLVMGPSREAARLESSKIYSKEFMVEAGVPTARHFVVSTVAETRKAAAAFAPPYVLKADGLAAGKGVFICKTEAELLSAADDIFVKRTLGEAGKSALLEEFSPGYEISYLVLTNGESYAPLVLAQDHKRLLDNDEGPNTGGMGVVAPVEIEASLRERINREVVEPSVLNLKKRGLMFRGVLFIGLMMTTEGPSVLEYNVRFGDPETQVILPLLDGDWGHIFHELAEGRLSTLKWKPLASACVVLAAKGYPDTPVKGAALTLPGEGSSSRYLLHAGTARSKTGARSSDWITNGGRVLNAIGIAANLREAVDAAYAIAAEVKSEALTMRTDIGRRQFEN